MHGWTHRDSLELYNLEAWGAGFFTVNDRGHVEVRPQGPSNGGIDLLELVRDLEQRGMRAPLLIRFSDILAARVRGISHAFGNAIREYGYRGQFRGVFPIKVNQQRHVVEEIVEYGAEGKVGLEAGSKPELLDRARAARHPGRADRLQRLQGPRLHRDRAARAAARAHPDHRDRPLPRDRPRDQDLARARHPPAHRRARAAHREGRGQVGRLDRRPLEVRALRARDRPGGRAALATRTCSTASSCCTSTSARRSPRSAPTRTRSPRRAGSSSACTSSARAPPCSTSAAGSASTTTARAPTSTPRRTTPPRSTRTTWSR